MNKRTFKTMTLDTLSAIATGSYVEDVADNKTRTHNQWKDEGISLYALLKCVNSHGGQVIFIVGDPGSGKTFGMRTLDYKRNLWFNADDKPPTFPQGRQMYPVGKYNHRVPKTFKEIIGVINAYAGAGRLDPMWYMFIICHSKTINRPDGGHKYVISLPGQWASKIHLDGLSNNLYFASIVIDEETEMPKGVLRVVPEPESTARSPHHLFGETVLTIPNDYQLIVEKLDNY